MRRGEVWTAVGSGYGSKPRPVVIVQDDSFPDTDSVTVCPLTSNATEVPLLRIPVEPTTENGLSKPSQVMVEKIATVPRAKVRDRVGALTAEQLTQVSRSLVVFLGIAG